MKHSMRYTLLIIPLVMLLLNISPASAVLFVQCPGDLNNDAVPDPFMLDPNGVPTATPNPDFDPNVICMHITGGDGFAKMADGKDQYLFSFGNYTGNPALNMVMLNQTLKAQLPAPTIISRQGQKVYVTMTNVGMNMRPDLFDPHSIHWHGFPNAAPIFDGLPEPSPTANMGASFTYFYNPAVPGTYFYHCHVEAAEHMQMGMIGNLWVYPGQSYLPNGTMLGSHQHSNAGDADAPPFGDFPGPGDVDLNSNGIFDEGAHDTYVYNDGDGSTGYDVEYPILFTGFDSHFHDQHLAIQALPFASMSDNYTMINGRGYPDTVNPGPIMNNASSFGANGDYAAQITSSLITAQSGQRILLRVSNVSTTHIYSFGTTLGIPMHVIGRGAAMLRGPDGKDTSMMIDVLNVGGGEHYDVLLDTTNVPAGTYFLYATTLENLANGDQERGGLMTEIVIN